MFKHLPRLGIFLAIAVAAFSLLTSAEAALKTPKPDKSDAFFTNGNIPYLKIEITGSNLANLRRENRKSVRAKLIDGDKVYEDVGIHLKGAAGSFQPLEAKPALTLNMDKFKDGQDFHGLDKFHLNNSVQDPSYMTELICGELFRAAGVPATRVTHARVELNGRFLGLYVLKEGFDKQFLRRYFHNPNGNLYDGGFIREITDPLELDSGEGDVPNRADLKALAAAAAEPDAQKRWAELNRLLDMDCMISFMALEVMTWHWDGYTIHRNNYRVYHEPTANKIYFFPHGLDQMFWVPEGRLIQPNWEGLVAQGVITTPEGRKRYKERIATLLTNIFTAEALTSRIDQLQKRLRPVLAKIGEHEARNHDGAVRNLRNQVVARVEGVARLLNMPDPKPLKFDSTGLATLGNWRVRNVSGSAVLNETDSGGKKTLHIKAGQAGTPAPSWRTSVLLEPGQYAFEGRIKTAGVVAFRNDKGHGAGLRISRSARGNRLTGDNEWTPVKFDFPVPGLQEVELICELTATKGEAWFELSSLRLRKK